MKHSNTLTLATPDDRGETPDLGLLHTNWRHSGNEKVYEVIAFVWGGADDRWLVLMRSHEPSAVAVARPLDHLTGRRENGEFRYTHVTYTP